MATFPVTILENPRHQLRLFNRAAIAAYGAACTTVHQHGLLGYIVNDQDATDIVPVRAVMQTGRRTNTSDADQP